MRQKFMKAIAVAVILMWAASSFAGEQCCPPEPAKPKCCQEIKSTGPLTDKSIYQVESTWTTDFGKPLKLSQLRGTPQVFVMFFASCEYACPIMVHDLKRLEAALPENIREKVGITLITFDHERDTVEALHAFRQRMNLPTDRWTLLRAGPDDALEIAALLGVKFKPEARGQFAHSNLMTILNSEGEIVHQIAGLQQKLDPAVQVLKSLAAE